MIMDCFVTARSSHESPFFLTTNLVFLYVGVCLTPSARCTSWNSGYKSAHEVVGSPTDRVAPRQPCFDVTVRQESWLTGSHFPHSAALSSSALTALTPLQLYTSAAANELRGALPGAILLPRPNWRYKPGTIQSLYHQHRIDNLATLASLRLR